MSAVPSLERDGTAAGSVEGIRLMATMRLLQIVVSYVVEFIRSLKHNSSLTKRVSWCLMWTRYRFRIFSCLWSTLKPTSSTIQNDAYRSRLSVIVEMKLSLIAAAGVF